MQDPAVPSLSDSVALVPGVHAGGPMRVRVVAPAGPVEGEDLDAGIAVLRERGFIVQEGRSTRCKAGYFAGDDAARLADLQQALDDPECDILWFARGGYGTTRLLPHLAWSDAARPKTLAGFSDATALHLWASELPGLNSLYAPSVTELGHPGAVEFASLWAALEGKPAPIPGAGPQAPAGPYTVTGGCLSLCVCSAGTSWSPETEGRWLFLEDVGEKLYRVDRMVTHLAQAGWFAGVAGVLLGSFTGLEEGETCDQVTGIVAGWVPSGIPIITGLPVGHCLGKHTLPLGPPARWDGRSLRFDP